MQICIPFTSYACLNFELVRFFNFIFKISLININIKMLIEKLLINMNYRPVNFKECKL